MPRLIRPKLLPKTNILNDIASFNTAVNITGNVGIGTTNPIYPLDIFNNDANGCFIRITGESSNRAGVILSEATADPNPIIMEYDGTGVGSGNYFTMYSEVNGWAGKGSGFTYIPSTGYVGIGNTNPSQKLHIKDGHIMIENTASDDTDSKIMFKEPGYDEVLFIASDLSGTPANEALYFGKSSVSGVSPSTALMTIKGNGRVGIATTDPSVALQVGYTTSTDSSTLLVAAGDAKIATIAAYGEGQGTGMLYLGQSSLTGGGIIYNGDDIPNTVGVVDTVSFFRRNNGTDTVVFRYAFNNSYVYFNDRIYVADLIDAGNYIRCYLYLEIQYGSANYWRLRMGGSSELFFQYVGNNRGYLRYNVDVGYIDFTGQHRSHNTNLDITKHLGLIVSSTGIYNNLNDSNADVPTINESLPEIELSSIACDKRVYGVISDKEDEGSTREYTVGIFVSIHEKKEGDNRIIINSLGEGGIWVCSINGNLENGDYITSSSVKGYGMKQNDDILHSYTVAKITCDCNFNNIPVKFDKRYLNANGDTITEQQYNSNIIKNIPSYKAVFVGCTYHCG